MPYLITDKSPDCAGWATIKEDGEVIGCHGTKQAAIDQMVAVSIAEGMEPGGERVDAPAPAKDQIMGSDENAPGSATGKTGDIALSEATETALQNKADEHNKAMADADRPSWTRVRIGSLRSVYRRGAGAYSSSHRPGMTRNQWAMARVNAFLFLARNGRPENARYVGDNDLLDKDHPKYSEAESNQRTQDADETIIVDIDGTLLNGSQPIRRVIDYVNKLHAEYYIYIVTARMESEEESTIRDLDAAGVMYDDIEFKEDESQSTPDYKAEKAQDILEESPVRLAIDNDPDNLSAFRELGIAVLDPADIGDGENPELRELPDNYRPAASPDVPANRNCGNCLHYKNFYCERWDAQVSPAYYCNAWAKVGGLPNENPGQTVQTGDVNDEDPQYQNYSNTYDRQLSFDVPAYIRSAARKGLDYYGQGLGGDGLVARTIREAREMAAGRISEDKVIRANAWGARHLVDLEAPQNSDADNDMFPGAGAVAFYLWGIDPLDPGPAMNWFERQAARVREEEGRLGYLKTLERLSRLFVDK